MRGSLPNLSRAFLQVRLADRCSFMSSEAFLDRGLRLGQVLAYVLSSKIYVSIFLMNVYVAAAAVA